VVGPCKDGNEPLVCIRSREFLDRVTFSFSRRAVLHGVRRPYTLDCFILDVKHLG
jgi:hypothetical protein